MVGVIPRLAPNRDVVYGRGADDAILAQSKAKQNLFLTNIYEAIVRSDSGFLVAGP